MIETFRHLDRILRGEATRPDQLRDEGLRIPVGGLTLLLIALGAIYGVCMGVYSIAGEGSGDPRQVAASAFKVPLLFVLTLIVTLPSLYVFNALVGSRLGFGALIRMLVSAMGVTMAVLASIGPIVAFFSVSTTSYPFMTLLNVVVFAVSGMLGLSFLKQTLNRLTAAQYPASAPLEPRFVYDPADPAALADPAAPPLVEPPPLPPSAIDRIDGQRGHGEHTRGVFTIWMIVFGLVGSQMAWILRPFIGSPGKAFTWFRPRGSNFFVAVWDNLMQLFQS